MSLTSVAARVAARRYAWQEEDDDRVSFTEGNLDRPATEYSCHVELSFSVDFEGKVAKDTLVKKLRREIMSALESSATIVAQELQLQATGIMVKPVQMNVAVNDQISVDEEEGAEE